MVGPGGWVARGTARAASCVPRVAPSMARHAPTRPTRPSPDSFRARQPRRRRWKSGSRAGSDHVIFVNGERRTANSEAPRGGGVVGPVRVGAGRVGRAGDGKGCVLRASRRAVHGATRPHSTHPPGPRTVSGRASRREENGKEEAARILITRGFLLFLFHLPWWVHTECVSGRAVGLEGGRVAPWRARREARRSSFCRPPSSPTARPDPAPP